MKEVADRVFKAIVARRWWAAKDVLFDVAPRAALEETLRRWRVASIEFMPPQGSPLDFDGTTVRLRADQVICPIAMMDGRWEQDVVGFFVDYVSQRGAFTLLDIGANAGLVTRQLLGACPRIVRAYCFEPYPDNAAHLTHNVAPFPRVEIERYGLGEQDTSARLYRDASNSGNYSLNESAMAGAARSEGDVPLRDARAVFTRVLDECPSGGLLWKSDTQGFDELIAARAPDALWARVDACAMEMSRISKPAFDRDRFCHVVTSFPNVLLSTNQAREDGVEAVLRFLNGPQDGLEAQLYLWR